MAADADRPTTELNGSDTDATPIGTETVDAEPHSGTDSVDASADRAADDDNPALDDAAEADSGEAATTAKKTSHVRLATLVGLAAVTGLTTLVGWLGFTAYQRHQAEERRELFVAVGRQGALNLTTIDWQHADADVKRVLDSATGTFYDDFARRQQPFIEVVKKAQATSKGTITEAALESESGDEAQVLVAVSVKTSNIGAPEQEPRAWRMRISVQKSGDQAKISNVAFVP